VTETGATYQAAVLWPAHVPPRFDTAQASASAVKPGPAAEPETCAGQADLLGAPARPHAGQLKAKPLDATPQPERAAQPVLIPSPPQGSYQQCLSRVMALRSKGTPETVGKLMAALGDEEERSGGWRARCCKASAGRR
jgi:hypothetical protein